MKRGDQFHAPMRACVASVLLVCLIFLGSGFAVAQDSPQLMDHTMCKGLNEKKEPVGRTDTFSTQDASAYSSIKIGPVYGAHKVDWNWYSPNRELYYSSTRNIDPLSKGPYYLDWDWASCLIFIKGQDAERLPGDWHVEVLVDGRLVATEKFSLISQSEKGSYTYTTLPEEKTTRDLIAEGNAFLGQGKYDEALQAYDNALQLDPRLADAWYDKGVVLNKQGKYDQAIAAYDEAIELNPEFAYAWCNKGDSLQKKGSYEDAIKAYDKAIELDPTDAYPVNNKGVVLSKQGKYEAAIEAFDQALGIDPNNEEALSNKRTAEAALTKKKPSTMPTTREILSAVTPEGESAPVKVGSDQVKLPTRASLIETSEWGEVPVNQVLVVLRDGKGRSDADRVAASLGGQVVGFFGYINLYQIETSATTESELKDAVTKAKQDADVELAFPNQQSYPDTTVQGVQCGPLDDPVYAEGGRGKGYEMIGVQRAWDLIRVSGLPLSKVHVGVVDDGLYKGNDEFNGDVKIDTSEPHSELKEPLDQFGSHGTRIMNIIAADPDNGGITGIASQPLKDKLTVSMVNDDIGPYGITPLATPDPNDPTKVLWHTGRTFAIGSLLAINERINEGATIISCSWGNRNDDPETAAAYKKFFEKMAADHPDVLFVCSAGNNGKAPDGTRSRPGGLNLPNMITVGNVMNDGTKAASSNMASANFEVTLAAPGEQSVKGFDNQGNIINEGGGTSMATPQVTSAAALIRAMNPDLTAGQIKDIIVQSARTSIDIDGEKVPAPLELGGRILAIDQAVFKVINDQRKKLGLEPFQDMDAALSSARIDLSAENDPASPHDWKVTAQVLGVEADGADVTFELQGEVAVGGDTKQHLTEPGTLTWDVTTKDSAMVVVKRLDTNGCNRTYLLIPFVEIQRPFPEGEKGIPETNYFFSAIETNIPNNAKYKWDFGKGKTFVGERVTTFFRSEGEYTVGIKAIWTGGSAENKTTIEIGPPSVEIQKPFILQTEKGAPDTPYFFSVIKSDIPDDAVYEWSFGDGGTEKGEEVIHKFAQEGDYTIRVRASWSGGSAESETVIGIEAVDVTICPVKELSGANVCSACEGEKNDCQFVTTCASPAKGKFEWSFGDGGTATYDNSNDGTIVKHHYSSAGTYTVSVAITAPGFRSEGHGQIRISECPPPSPPESDFERFMRTGLLPGEVQ